MFANNSYATVWSIRPGKGNWTDVRISTSRKNKQTGEYEQDFGGFVRLVGEAQKSASRLQEKSRIVLENVGVTNRFDKESNKEFTSFAVFSFRMADDTSTAPASAKPAKKSAIDEPHEGNTGDEDDLPF